MVVENNFAALPPLLGLVGDLVQETREHAPGEKQELFEYAVAAHTSRFVEGVIESAKASCNGSWPVLEPGWQDVRARAEAFEKGVREEREKRVQELGNPDSEEDFRANLFWIVERGQEDDLKLLQRLKQDPPYTSDEIVQLLDLAMQRIRERTRQRDDSPTAVQRQGEGAYGLHKEEWDRRYAGRYIAIYQGEVIASDTKKIKLMEKIVRKQREEGPFRACVMKIESSAAGSKKPSL